MSDATDAVVDIVEAIDEYGSDLTMVLDEGTYNTTTGELTVESAETADIVTKCIVHTYNSSATTGENPDIHVGDLRFMIYYDGEITYEHTLEFDGKVYQIINIDKKIFQNVNILYTIQGRA